jgi:hypothetical protein
MHTGKPTPAVLLRVATEIRIDIVVNANTGNPTEAHAPRVNTSERSGGRRVPDNPRRGCRPMTTSPAPILLAASIRTAIAENVNAVRVFPAKISRRDPPRVSSVDHVP